MKGCQSVRSLKIFAFLASVGCNIWFFVNQTTYFRALKPTDSIKMSDLIGLATNDKRLIEFTRDFLIKPADSAKPYVLEAPEVLDTSNFNISKLILTLTNNKTGGFFVECGAHDGESTSNTLFLERKFGWTGLLVEAAPRLIAKIMTKNRKAWIAPTCLSITNTSMMSKFHDNNFGGSIRFTGPKLTEGIQVEALCIPFNTFMHALDVKEVDFFSLDVESYEWFILNTINFKEVKINILSVEFILLIEPQVKDLLSLLKEQGFRLISRTKQDLIYVHETFVLPAGFVPWAMTDEEIIQKIQLK